MALNDDIKQLTEIPIFRHLDGDALRLLAFAAETKLLRAGDVLFREGEPSDGAFFLTTGTMELHSTENGATLPVSAPSLLGELALVTDTMRPATAAATSPSLVRHISKSLFHRVLDESPTSATKIRTMIAKRIGDLAAELDRFATGGDSDRR